jgi:hypothetical protein
MDISHINVTIDVVDGSLMAHVDIHIAINKNENSLIWPSDVHDRKLFFFVCHINHSINIVIIGFIINTNTEKMTISFI